MFHLFQTYVAIDASCCKCSMSKRRKWAQVEWSPRAQRSRMCVGSEVGAAAPMCMHSNRRKHIQATGGAGPAGAAATARGQVHQHQAGAASICVDGQQARVSGHGVRSNVRAQTMTWTECYAVCPYCRYPSTALISITYILFPYMFANRRGRRNKRCVAA
jgi:hypothetical protein